MSCLLCPDLYFFLNAWILFKKGCHFCQNIDVWLQELSRTLVLVLMRWLLQSIYYWVGRRRRRGVWTLEMLFLLDMPSFCSISILGKWGMKTRNLTNDVVSITSNVKASSWLFFAKKRKTDKVRQQCRKTH